MTPPRRATAAVAAFVDTLRAEATRRQRRAFLDEYVAWVADQGDGAVSTVATEDLLDEENALAWLTDAQRGLTRRRPGLEGPTARASVNSMAARTSSVNTFSRYCGQPLELQPPAPEFADRLTPTEAHRTLRLLSGHHPAGMLESTWERSVALIALAVCTGQGISALHPMRLTDLELERSLPRARVGEDWYPIDAVSRGALARWKATHQALTAGHLKVLKGGNVEELWVTTAPGRPRGGKPAPPAGLPAAVRTLEAAHRKLTATALGSPLLFEQFCGVEEADQ
ncbi:hypothetical protein HUT19_41660 (plasmid) [Streptomyces sp. NA02950]|uniref:hypothetical protein n=1 Tax=Streptomyces sp. NA02950 TaxID=2742137 RepID=UPI00158FA6DC|nr:hypothetical protein [Streptomyces sp. NA02950]QKV98230.1 hypothetical protein HUT19_41660 [Streptomyces sp. NA02950]